MERSRAATPHQRLDELYHEHPDGFVAGRDQLVKQLREAGEGDEAERVRRLRRPTMAAWLINRAALENPAQLEEFAAASRQLEDAQGKALAGGDQQAGEWRAAAAREREATDGILDLAERLARDAGHPASGRALELAGETLRAATADPELRERVLHGRVERERSAATLGTPALAALPRRKVAPPKRRGLAIARRDLERLERELADATAREKQLRAQVEQTAQALRREKANLAGSRRQTADLKRQVKAAERRAQD